MAAVEAIAAVAPYESFLTRSVEAVADDLESFARLLAKWNRVQNLVSRETLSAVWTRHVADSLQLLRLLDDAHVILDLGSGGGFPALPLAVALKGSDVTFLLVEPNARKVSFLRTVARELGLAVSVEGRRAEAIDSRETAPPDVITARAVTPLAPLLTLAQPFFGPNTRALFHKGREHVDELLESAALWQHDVVIHRSDTDPSGVLLEISNLRLRNS